MNWKEKYSFRRVIGITNSTSKSQIEKDLINNFKKNLEEKGLPIKKVYKVEWDKKRSNSFARDYIYEELKEEYEKLTRKMENEGQKEV